MVPWNQTYGSIEHNQTIKQWDVQHVYINEIHILVAGIYIGTASDNEWSDTWDINALYIGVSLQEAVEIFIMTN